MLFRKLVANTCAVAIIAASTPACTNNPSPREVYDDMIFAIASGATLDQQLAHATPEYRAAVEGRIERYMQEKKIDRVTATAHLSKQWRRKQDCTVRTMHEVTTEGSIYTLVFVLTDICDIFDVTGFESVEMIKFGSAWKVNRVEITANQQQQVNKVETGLAPTNQ